MGYKPGIVQEQWLELSGKVKFRGRAGGVGEGAGRGRVMQQGSAGMVAKDMSNTSLQHRKRLAMRDM